MIQPRLYQQEAVDSIFNYYACGKTGNPVVAMPTATGKSVVIAWFVRTVLMQWPRQRFVMSTHVKELIEQNANKMRDVWPEAPLGIYSAGLSSRDTAHPIVFGGVQSMVNRIDAFGWRDLLIVDEAHLISPKEGSNYQELIAGLKRTNPNLKVIGLTATKYRLGQGLLTEGDNAIFHDICYDLTSLEQFNRLIYEGWLCPLIPKRTGIELNVSDVRIQAGDYVQKDLQAAVDKDRITYAACKEICEYGFNRRSWLVFASGIEHSDHVAACLQSMGIDAASLHSKVSDEKRERYIKDFKSYKLRCIVNNNVLTTGFDHPGLDLIGVLRPTTSPVLWVQLNGRGTRPLYAPGHDLASVEGRLAAIAAAKPNCLVLDFAGNTRRLGPINDPVIPKQRKKGEHGVAPIRICEHCGTYNHARATHCIFCGKPFESLPKIKTQADTAELIKTDKPLPDVRLIDVNHVIYNRIEKNGQPPMIKVSYLCGLQKYDEYICFEHFGYARKKAHDWWRNRIGTLPPLKTDEALMQIKQLREPKQIRVWLNKGKYPEVMSAVF